jgi:hypothetical protein
MPEKSNIEISNNVLVRANKNIINLLIPDNIDYIEHFALKDCVFLKNVKISRSVVVIGESAFQNCRSLTDISIPKNVKHIGNYTFKDCINLKSIIIPSDTIIGAGFLDGCYKLQKLVYGNNEYNITVIENTIFTVQSKYKYDVNSIIITGQKITIKNGKLGFGNTESFRYNNKTKTIDKSMLVPIGHIMMNIKSK